MNEVTLERDLSVWAGNVVGQVARAKKRDELYAITLRTREESGTDADDIARHLLHSDEPTCRRIAANLLHICEQYGLLESKYGRYALTDDGERVTATERVFVPQQGAWQILASDDRLLRAPVIDVEPFDDPSAFDEVRGKDKSRERPMSDVPKWLRQSCKQTFKTISSVETRLDELEHKAECVEPNASLRLKWNVWQGHLRLAGKLDKRDVDTELDAPEKSPDELWQNLLEGADLWNDWDDQREELLVFFDDTTDVERQSMKRRIVVSPFIPEFGAFDSLPLELPINAATLKDAQRWAEWRLVDGIDDYATEAHYGKRSRQAAAPFAHYDVSLPTRAELARKHPTKGDLPNWHLVATQDWRL